MKNNTELPIAHKLVALLDGMSIERAQHALQAAERVLLSSQFVSAHGLLKSITEQRGSVAVREFPASRRNSRS